MHDIEISITGNIDTIPAEDWDRCAAACGPFDPFTSHRFLAALEHSRSVGDGTGWQVVHIVAQTADGVAGVMPLYAKSNSQGEYIFDHAWADAYQRAGGDYYPKLLSAAPFTPATGPRLLSGDPVIRAALVDAAIGLAQENGLSSFHINFCTAQEHALGPSHAMLQRITEQFHWENANYKSFDGFLAALSSRKRKMIRRERRQAQEFGGQIVALTGEQIQPAHWDAFWTFYQDTGARKWGHPYLTRPFFDEMQETMRDDILLVLAERDGRYIAGALNFIGGDSLFGRYWGCVENHPALHFELCYYQAIDYAIENGLQRVEAGAQGEHKLARGYLPAPIYSLHWIADEGFRTAVDRYLQDERAAVSEDIEVVSELGPFKKGNT